MFDRDLPDDLVDALNQSPFWGNICEDRELHPEIRRRCITVYYKGRGLIRDMQVRAGVLTGKVHWKYVPTQQPTNDDYFDLVSQTCGLEFVSPVLPRSPGLCTREILKDYKCQMDGARSFPESDLIQKIICREENQVLDQEVAFQDQDTARDKIDLCNFDTGLQKLTFVEVKQVDDARLSAKKGPPEVLEQLRAYGCRLNQQRDEILRAYQRTTVLKRQLGLQKRLLQVPLEGPQSLLERPILVIGNCTGNDVSQILSGKDQWKPLWDGLKDVAAGLILCGTNGCRLKLEKGVQSVVF